ncbi:hypothetical protein B0H16DRAFT_1727404 [Mycena metata]|uniref:Uncharacterized protein n=1 Tax=Mycena metata TaxID=1033252 RepID=A0AAD7ILP1_9AGAR|nr:hypothetical protein B0H16DRAFT_1727404 [Mycena metata]
MSTNPTDSPLDLYNISLLLNYERASTDPRFIHARLRHVVDASTPLSTPVAAIVLAPQWIVSTGEKDGFIFEIDTSASGPDLPSNMLPSPVPAALNRLTPKQLESIYWQTRDHDGCYQSIALLQHFFDLYPIDVSLRVRTCGGKDFITPAFTRVILELKLIRPKRTTITYFGDAGRGLGGRSTFALESLDAFYKRMATVALSADTKNPKITPRMRPAPDDVDAWLKTAAKRA